MISAGVRSKSKGQKAKVRAKVQAKVEGVGL
jgi:hypothetical protein